MQLFEQLEKIKARGFIGAVGFMPGDNGVVTTVVVFGTVGNLEHGEEPGVQVTAQDGETIEQTIYRGILEFDEKYPE